MLPASAWNATGSANDACEASYGKADAWQCFFGQNVAKFIKTPMFVLNRWVHSAAIESHSRKINLER